MRQKGHDETNRQLMRTRNAYLCTLQSVWRLGDEKRKKSTTGTVEEMGPRLREFIS